MNELIKNILKSQMADGSFVNADLLTLSILLLELSKIPDTPELSETKRQIEDYILGLKNSRWLFSENYLINYVATAAVFKQNPAIIGGGELAKILKNLSDTESQEGGPYYSSPKTKTIDIGVNCAIAFFLALNKVELPNLKRLIESAIARKEFSTDYYANELLVIYLISNFYHDALSDDFKIYVSNYNCRSENDLDKLLFSITSENLSGKVTPSLTISDDEKLIGRIIESVDKRLNELDFDFQKIAKSIITRTLNNNPDKQMSLIAYYFRKAQGDKGSHISDEMVIEAGVANIFFWTAFIIYDDFWDEDERATPHTLPCANLLARHYISYYDNILPNNPEFAIFFHSLMDNLDSANSWETLNCRTKVNSSKFSIPAKLPDYENYERKFHPASGQILGPLVLLNKAGYNLDSLEAKNLIEFFKNYLIAMQINDDAHDLMEDLERGHLSTVVVLFLNDWLNAYPEAREIDLKSDLDKIQQIFWFKTIPQSSKIAMSYTKKSRAALSAMKSLSNPSPLSYFIDKTEEIAKTALNEYQKSLNFLEEFK